MKTFYNNIQSCVINNGVSSNFFTLELGVRQGDPFSLYLVIIAVGKKRQFKINCSKTEGSVDWT